MHLQKNNFGLKGQSFYAGYDDEGYDNLFKKFREKRAEKKEEKQEKKADKKQRKEDKRSERQDKRESSSEKRRLKNEMKQTQIEEKKAQLSILNQQGQAPTSGPAPAGGDNSMMIVAAVVGVIFIAGVGYVMMKKPTPAPVLLKAA
jgi:FtsZ-interacting cell division protein YlmF